MGKGVIDKRSVFPYNSTMIYKRQFLKTTLSARAIIFVIIVTFCTFVTSCVSDDSAEVLFFLKGVFKSAYGEVFTVTDHKFTCEYQDNSGSKYLSYDGTIEGQIAYDGGDAGSGILIIKYLHNNNITGVIGNYYAIAFRDLTTKGVFISGAYKAGGKNSCLTKEEAAREFTIDNGYFSAWSECTRFY